MNKQETIQSRTARVLLNEHIGGVTPARNGNATLDQHIEKLDETVQQRWMLNQP